MKTEQPVLITSIRCTNEFGINKHRLVYFDGNLGRESHKSLGVCYADSSFNEMMPVMSKGIALITTADSIDLGAPVEAFDDGTVRSYSSGFIEGFAMDEATGAGQLIRVLLA